jgi:hypothetical protein
LFNLPYSIATSTEKVSSRRRKTTAGSSARSRHHARKSLLKIHPARINLLHVRQNAAALLFDLGTVDIR